ncbi:DUF6629 family protein [Nodosilinea nodulosa]|uniref:DUF6629 family protein n=1 Tax=Nodosilinea nodulosa TaxID=416001 RepID=UPI003BF5CB7B
MCFSASVSFAASAVLIPVGVYCIRVALSNTAYLPFAAVPLAFGIQQGFEGVIWSGIHANNAVAMHFGALAFLLFFPLVLARLAPLHCATTRTQSENSAGVSRLFAGRGTGWSAALPAPGHSL